MADMTVRKSVVIDITQAEWDNLLKAYQIIDKIKKDLFTNTGIHLYEDKKIEWYHLRENAPIGSCLWNVYTDISKLFDARNGKNV